MTVKTIIRKLMNETVFKTVSFCLALLLLVPVISLSFYGCSNSSVKDNPALQGNGVTQQGNGYRIDKNGWIYIHIEGEPHDRGFQYGYLVAPELEEILRSLKYITYWDTGMEWEFFVGAAEKMFLKYVDEEYLEEMKGIADGARAAGVDMTWQEVLAWNGYEELVGYWWPNEVGEL